MEPAAFFKIHPGSQASSRVEATNSVLLSSWDGYLLEPTEWPKGSQASCGVLRAYSGLFSRPYRKRRASSRDDGGISWFFSSCGVTCGVSLELRRVNQGVCRVAPGMSSLHSSCEGERSIALESRQGTLFKGILSAKLFGFFFLLGSYPRVNVITWTVSLSLSFLFSLAFFSSLKKKILGVSKYLCIYSLVSVSEAHQRKLKSCIFLEHFLRQPSVEANYILSVYFFFSYSMMNFFLQREK